MGDEEVIVAPIFRDVRRYYCQFCGICRSKKALINSHLLSHHKEEMEEQGKTVDGGGEGAKSNTCEECGATFKKPAHLKQHMQSHSLEDGRPPEKLHQADLDHAQCARFDVMWREALDPYDRTPKCEGLDFLEWVSIRLGDHLRSSIKQASITHYLVIKRLFRCTIDDCQASYRRKDHLNRHLLQHKGKLFNCPVDGCSSTFAYQANMKRHVKEFHDNETPPRTDIGKEKQHACLEPGCNKVFRYASKLQKHEDSHVKLDSVETVCAECMGLFTNEECLRAHVQSCHRYRICEICGTEQLQKNFKRHMRTHEENLASEKFRCEFKGCLHTFSTKSNLFKHVKAVHLELRPFSCGFPGCNERFAYKHVRDNHEKTGKHVYTNGDFEETDEQFRSRPRGGRKRHCPTIETLMRKRVSLPMVFDSMMNENEYE